MHILITGSSGFVGRALAERLQSPQCPPPLAGASLTLLDVSAQAQVAPGCRTITGSLDDAATVRAAFAEPPDVVIHLASVPGGMAEQHGALARAANIDGTLRLLEAAQASGKRPRFVFASSIAVLGSDFGALVDDNTPLRPQMSYGAHKQIGEILVHDFSRRQCVDGISLRLPGIVARPPAPAGQLSAFMSGVMHALAAHEPYVCPVSPDATMWLLSVARTVDNLLHAALLSLPAQDTGLALTLPALHVSMAQLCAAVAAEYGACLQSLLRHEPDERLQAAFGRYPALHTSQGDRLGFVHDGDVPALVRRAMRKDVNAPSRSA